MMTNQKAKKLCVDGVRGCLERKNEPERYFRLSESEFDFDSSNSGAYESNNEELYDSVILKFKTRPGMCNMVLKNPPLKGLKLLSVWHAS
jgi:hypothetical protein